MAKAHTFPQMTAEEFARIRETIGTQEDVANDLQTARRSIGRWERGERPVPGVAAVAIQLLADKATAARAKTVDALAGMGAAK